MNLGRIVFIILLVASYSSWIYFLENGLDLIDYGAFLLVLFFWMLGNIIVTIIGVHEMS